jgi:hypothetical protein
VNTRRKKNIGNYYTEGNIHVGKAKEGQ